MRLSLWVFILSLISVVAILSLSMSCTSPVNFDLAKKHHGKNSFKSSIDVSLFQWFQMILKEGLYPDVDPEELASIQEKTDLKKINASAEVPRATWIGHATVLVQYKNINFLTDPHLSTYVSPVNFGAKRITPPALSFEEMPEIDFVVISHNHYDHLDHRTIDMFGSS